MIQLHHWGSQKVRTPHCDYSCIHPSLLLLSSFLLPPSPLFVAVGASKAAWLSISCYETSVMSAPMKGWSCLSRWSPAGGFSDCRRGCHLGMKASIQRHLGEWMPSDYFCICHLQFCSFLHVIRAGHPRESKWHGVGWMRGRGGRDAPAPRGKGKWIWRYQCVLELCHTVLESHSTVPLLTV